MTDKPIGGIMAEHRVVVLTSRDASNGHCQTCGWAGPLRRLLGQASYDAALHADEAWRKNGGADAVH